MKCSKCGYSGPDQDFEKGNRSYNDTVGRCKPCKAETDRVYRTKNKEKLAAYFRTDAVRAKQIAYSAAYRKANKKKIAIKDKKYQAANKEKIREYQANNRDKTNARQNNKRANDPKFRLDHNMGVEICKALNRYDLGELWQGWLGG
ncbi:hypothetical protein LCGC14_1440740 [marine sediment metagenome]|uniref:Uncharacterized protein n=1 Tax=marine sediment metagenome TaxID=412755 RepID=A0A0F9JLD4_9ZZZZ